MKKLIGSKGRHWGHGMMIFLMVMLGGGILMLWSWNTFAVDLFQAPEIRFRHVLALQVGIASILSLPYIVAHLLWCGRKHLANQGPVNT
ncbi:MAG: hypothetical protein HQL52_15390 [Magnetococcales bacterium]|nr:hypothetical protein [Magnetococcales bacterium]